MKFRPFRLDSTAGFLLCLGVALAAFWRVLFFPFVQDDWLWLELFRSRDATAAAVRILDPQSRFFYRPAAELWLLLMHETVGLRTWPFHVAAVLVHSFNAWLAGRIAGRVAASERLGMAVALVYAAAVAIHLDPMVWAVGAYDLGGALCFLGAIWFHLSGRPVRSAACYLAGCLFKESVVVLPAVLAALDLAAHPGASRGRIRTLVARLAPHGAVLLFVVGLKAVGGRLSDGLPPSHPYALTLAGPQLFHNAVTLMIWLLQAFVPAGMVASGAFRWPLAALAVAAVALAAAAPRPRRRLILAFGFWALAALLPVLFLSNHCYRYYATYALPGFAGAVLLIAGEAWRRIARVDRPGAVAVAVAGLAAALSVVQANRALGEGFGQRTLADGTNGLVRRAAFVDAVEPVLRSIDPPPTEDVVLLLGGVDLWAFNKNSGPRVWCRQPSLRVADLADLRRDGDRWRLDAAAGSQLDVFTGARAAAEELAPERIMAFTFENGTLRRLDRDEWSGRTDHLPLTLKPYP